MNYVEPPDVPEGVTLREYRCRPKAVARPRRRGRLRRRLLRLLAAR
jgi:hypothetical protein